MGIDSREIELVQFDERGIWQSDTSIGHVFDRGLYKGIEEITIKYNKSTFWDLGCGDGSYTRNLKSKGYKGDGIDGNPNTPVDCLVRDLTQPLNLPKRDFSICIEVGEHIPKDYESILIKNICDSSDFIILSWASMYQVGAGHVNSKSNQEVIDLFRIKGYKFLGRESFLLRSFAIHWYFKKNILIFSK